MRLADLEGEKHLTTVQLGPDRTAVAEFRLDGPESYLQIYSGQPLMGWRPPEVIPTTLPDGTRVTFLDCVMRASGTHGFSEGRSHYAKLQPQWVTIGRRHLTEDVRLSSIDLLVDDASAIFHDFDAFGYAMAPENHIDGILAADTEKLGHTIARGEHPIIGYFTGRWTVCATDTALGRVSAQHALSQSTGGSAGIQLSSRIFMELRPQLPATLREAVDSIMIVLRFLEMIAGRPQNVLAVVAELVGESDVADHMEIYWPLQPRRRVDTERPDPFDMPLNGGINPGTFSEVLARWLAVDRTRQEARARYASTAAHQNRYGVDRLVSAANMFDVLPPDALPATSELTPELASARDGARQLFLTLPRSPERDSVLSALGRISQSSLKRKVPAPGVVHQFSGRSALS